MSVASAWKTAKWAAQQAWKLKGLINSEMLKVDTLENGTVITSAGTYSTHVTAVAVGDTDQTRTGNSIYVRSVNIRGQLLYNSTAGTTPVACCLMVVIDTQQVGDTGPYIGNVIDFSTNGVNAHVAKSTAGRFKILYRRVLFTDSVDRTVVPIDINLPMRHHVRYNGQNATDIQKGGIYILAGSDQGTNGPTLKYDCRLSYHDN